MYIQILIPRVGVRIAFVKYVGLLKEKQMFIVALPGFDSRQHHAAGGQAVHAEKGENDDSSE